MKRRIKETWSYGMPKSRGKKFESEISRMLATNLRVAFYYRPTDVPPASRARFTPRSPIDFYCYLQGGAGLVVECKSIKGTSLPFVRFSEHQWEALTKCWRGGVSTLVLVNHYGWAGRDGQRGSCYAVPFGELSVWRDELDGKRKSWPMAAFGTFKKLKKVTGSWELDSWR